MPESEPISYFKVKLQSWQNLRVARRRISQLARDDAMASNRGIFRDPREIADSCFFPDDGIARRAAIDGGVGATSTPF